MYNPIEIWKEYPLNIEHGNFYRVEVSNFGRVMTYNKLKPQGGILKGSFTEGYPVVRITLYRNRTDDVSEKIAAYTELISFLEQRKKLLKEENLSPEAYAATLEDLKNQKLAVVEKRKKYIKRTDKLRRIFVHFLIHRAVAELFLKKPENAEVVIHKDFNKTNNVFSNLAWVTKQEAFNRFSENPYYKHSLYLDQFKAGNRRQSKQEKLTVENVLYIKEMLKKGKTLRELASKFKVSDMQIHRIKTGENWSAVKTVSELKNEENKK